MCALGPDIVHGQNGAVNPYKSGTKVAAHYRLAADDVGLLVMPLFHVHGLIGATFSQLHAGGTLVVPPRFSAGSFWATAKAHRVTWYSAVPTMHQAILAHARGSKERLADHRLCEGVAVDDIAQLEACVTRVAYESGAIIVKRGDAADAYRGHHRPADDRGQRGRQPAHRRPGRLGRLTRRWGRRYWTHRA